MPAQLASTKRVEKPWGRRKLWPGFADPAPDGEPIGEVWFQTPDEDQQPLLIKYLFTSEHLSVQVHPNDEEAKREGHPRGKDEAWVILEAEPDATIALGTKTTMSKDELRQSSEDGSIEHKLDWKPVKAGEFIYSPAGTIHAIGGGLTLVEIQQNVDLTYRLYDYGSDRELHLKDGVNDAKPEPFKPLPTPKQDDEDRTLLAEGPKFVVERWAGGERRFTLPEGMTGWLVPLKGKGVVDGVAFKAGEAVTLEGEIDLHADAGSDLVLAYPGDKRIDTQTKPTN